MRHLFECVQDIPLKPNPGKNPYEQLISARGPIYAVGVSGACGPGTAVIVGDEETKDVFGSFLALYATNPDAAVWEFFRSEGATLHAFGRGVLLLAPGEVVHFPEPLDRVFALTLPAYRRPYGMGIGLASGVLPSCGVRPILRVWRERITASQCGYFRVAEAAGRIETIAATLPADDAATKVVAIPPAATHISLQMLDNVSGWARINTGESCELEVWWRNQTGLWCHNPADDWDASPGLGAADPTHDVEVYENLHSATGVCLVKPGAGNDFYCSVSVW